MAIYQTMNELEKDLERIQEALPEYNEIEEFRSGFDTAVDVITCVNSTTIWHKADPDHMPEGKVLIAQLVTRSIVTAFWAQGSWHTDSFGLIDNHAVLGWCELPDWPEGVIDSWEVE